MVNSSFTLQSYHPAANAMFAQYSFQSFNHQKTLKVDFLSKSLLL